MQNLPQSSHRRLSRAGSAALVLLLAGLVCAGCERKPVNPNVLFIVIDTLRADHVGAYGAKDVATPNLDAIAAQSLLFEQAFATSAWTKSSIASMLTGFFPSHISVLDRDDAIPDSVQTLAERLRARGYQTYGVTSNGNAGSTYGFAQGFDGFIYPPEQRRYPGGATTYPANGITTSGLHWLAERDPQRPFFLFLHYADPHDPYFPHPEMQCGEEPAGRFDGSRAALREMDAAYKRGELTEVDKARIRYLYACEIKFCDHWIGELVAALRRLHLWDDLLVVITADHGEGLWNHGERAHGRDLFDEMVHVPLIVKYPGRVPAARIHTAISLIDLAPTVLAAVGAAEAPEMQGTDLRPLADGGERDSEHGGIYSELGLDWVDLESLRTRDFKLLRARKLDPADPKAYTLFDLRQDPEEKEDVVRQSAATAESLKKALLGWHAFAKSSSTGHGPKQQVALEDLSPVELRSLHDLGYISDADYREAARKREQRERGGGGG